MRFIRRIPARAVRTLVLLWANLLVVFGLFTRSHRVQGYVWALHSCCGALHAWRPAPKVLRFPGLQRAAAAAGVAGICVFAWQAGPAVGVAGWAGPWQELCGWRVHLTACVGSELVAAGLWWGVGRFVVGESGL